MSELVQISREFLETRPLSYSSLKQFRKSPKHYIQYVFGEKKDKAAYFIGRAFEDYAFNRKYFDSNYQVFQKAVGTGSTAINAKIFQDAKDKGIILIDKEDMARLTLMYDSMMSVDYIRPYLEGIKRRQVELKWKDRKTGIPFIGYVDLESEAFDVEWAIDLKTDRDADPRVFPRTAYNFEYNMQWATYSEGYHKMKYKFPYFAYLVVENDEPFNCALYFIEQKMLEQDKEEWRNSVDAFNYCLENQMFHMGYEFLLQTMPYFTMRRPGYYVPRFEGGLTDEE